MTSSATSTRATKDSGKRSQSSRRNERGVTLILVALALIAMMAMAALSIDVITLYLANAEAQRAADSAALSAARILSISGLTGSPTDSSPGARWLQACNLATSVATAVAKQNPVGGVIATVAVTFPTDPGCTANSAFAVNPLVTVKISRSDLPTFFARIWGRTTTGISATATAEAFNSSNSGTVTGTDLIPVQPRCVKPLMVPNLDPGNPAGCTSSCNVAGVCTSTCSPLVSTTDGSLLNPGIRLMPAGTGTVGEEFNLFADCAFGSPCSMPDAPPVANVTAASRIPPASPNLEYLPGAAQNTSIAIASAGPTCGSFGASRYAEAIAGCDQNTAYQCGVQNANQIDLTENPGHAGGDASHGAQCLINQAGAVGQDTLDSTLYPYEIKAGSESPLKKKAGVPTLSRITSSNSIVSLPIYDSNITPLFSGNSANVTVVGFLQVFINQVNGDGSLDVTVLNVNGCGNGLGTVVGNPVRGSSPVPVRLVNYP